MDNVRENTLRIGNFTSSKVADLMSNGKQIYGLGKPATTYIKERNMERKLELPLAVESSPKPFSWGKCCEKRIFELMGTEYERVHEDTLAHPTISDWTGTPDAIKHEEDGTKTMVEFKCPITRKSFMEFEECETIEDVRRNHDQGEQYYWQAVSNSILLGATHAELIIYIPYLSELVDVREHAQDFTIDQLYKYLWIHNALDEELPYIKDNGKVKHVKKFRWKVSEADKEALTERIKLCKTLLIQR